MLKSCKFSFPQSKFSLIFILHFTLCLQSILRLQLSPSLLCTLTTVTCALICHEVNGKGSVYLFMHTLSMWVCSAVIQQTSVNPVIVPIRSLSFLLLDVPAATLHCRAADHSEAVSLTCLISFSVFLMKNRFFMNIFHHSWLNERRNQNNINEGQNI